MRVKNYVSSNDFYGQSWKAKKSIIIVNRYRWNGRQDFLSAGDKFMLEMYLITPGFTYSACGPFTKNKEKWRKFKETWD